MATPPAHLFGRQTIDLVTGRHRRTRILISRRQLSRFSERLRHQGYCLRARGQRRRTGGKSKGEFQKMTAFHDISLFAAVTSDARRF